MDVRLGTAGWGIPAAVRDRFAGTGTHLERYAAIFSCVEINSSFYRPHRSATYERWARSVPADFRFSLKLPKTITHERRLSDAEDLVAEFIDVSSALGVKRDVVLAQLPPSLVFDERIAAPFFAMFCKRYSGRIACEPRHRSWFTPAADALLDSLVIARVVAEPVIPGGSAAPGGSQTFYYTRLHGAPRIYSSAYEPAILNALATMLGSASAPHWCIFDNTASGAAAGDALALRELLERGYRPV